MAKKTPTVPEKLKVRRAGSKKIVEMTQMDLEKLSRKEFLTAMVLLDGKWVRPGRFVATDNDIGFPKSK